MTKTVVKNSALHGCGVFANQDFQAGDVIIDWQDCSKILTDPEVEALPPDERDFLSVIDGQKILFSPPARYVNHSCSPNARGTNRADVAIRPIVRGEEITVDYGAEQVGGQSVPCRCGSPNCRGYMTGPKVILAP